MLAAGAMMAALGAVSITPTHSAPARRAGASAMPPGPRRLIRHDFRAALGCSGQWRQMREVGLPVGLLAEQPAELLRAIGMNEIIALLVDDVNVLAAPHRRSGTVERPPHIDVDHEDAERLAVLGKDRRRDAERRPVDFLDLAVAATEVERRDVDLRRSQPGRFLEIAAIVSLQQVFLGYDPNRFVRPRTVDTDELAAIVVQADDPHHRVGRFGFELCRKTGRQPLTPCLLGNAVERIDAARPARADQSVQRHGGTKAQDISGRAGRIIFEVGRYLPRMRLDAVARALQERLFQVAIVQPSDRGNGDRDQRHHRDGKPRCERHVGVRTPSHSARRPAGSNRMLLRITCRKQQGRGSGGWGLQLLRYSGYRARIAASSLSVPDRCVRRCFCASSGSPAPIAFAMSL